MSKILLTGMTAPQVSSNANARTLGFAGQVYSALKLQDSQYVEWVAPKISWTREFLETYDVIMVGIAPITGLGSAHAYGALSVVGHLWGSPRLHLFVEAPNPYQITQSLASLLRNPENLIKDFYQKRPGFEEMHSLEPRNRVYRALHALATEKWPSTAYPFLPWAHDDVVEALPGTVGEHFTGLNFDIFTLNEPQKASMPAVDKWVVDNDHSAWRDSVANTLAYPVISMKRNKFSTDQEVASAMATSTGVLISPTKRGRTWWTYRYAQALNLGVPIVSEWRDTGSLGGSWSILAAQIEHLDDKDRSTIASDQRKHYKNSLKSEINTVIALNTFLEDGKSY